MAERVLRTVPDNVIAEIRDRVDLVDLVGGYVTLKRSGRNFLGLCPFHQEKTPSFNVSPDRGIYHCFGCGVTGDGIRFLMEHDNLSFQEALRSMAQRAGVDLSPFEGRGDDRAAHDYDQLYAAHALAARLYRRNLESTEGESARAEIRRRGLSQDTVEEFHVGASVDAWDRLLDAARREGIRPEILEKGGLVIRRDGGGHYDRFRNRLMFPIETAGPKVIGFGGRVLDDGEPKYLNSPESPLFQKRKTLYGAPQAMASLRETRHAILVEGYTDVLALANTGIRGAVAALGTAFTGDHARWLARTCDRVTVLFDGDAAGRKAAFASAGPLLGAGLDVRMGMLPPGEDPDSLVRSEGADAMQARIDKATEVVVTLLGDDAWDNPVAQERAVRRVLDALVAVEDPLRSRVYLDELSAAIGLPPELLERQIAERRSEARRRAERLRAREPSPESATTRPEPTAPATPAVPVAVAVSGPPHEAERTFVAILLHDEALGEGLLGKFGPDDFRHPLPRRIVETAVAMAAEGTPVTAAALMDSFADDAAALDFLGELAVADAYRMGIERQAEDCAVALERRRMERERNHIMTEMRKAKARGDEPRLRELGREQQELSRGIARLGVSRSTLR